MEAITLHGADRTHPDQFRVITKPKITGQARERLIKHEFAIAVTLEIQRGHSHELVVVAPQRQVQGLPALVGGDAAGTLQRQQPSPAVKRRNLITDQIVPPLLRNLADASMPASRERRHLRPIHVPKSNPNEVRSRWRRSRVNVVDP